MRVMAICPHSSLQIDIVAIQTINTTQCTISGYFLSLPHVSLTVLCLFPSSRKIYIVRRNHSLCFCVQVFTVFGAPMSPSLLLRLFGFKEVPIFVYCWLFCSYNFLFFKHSIRRVSEPHMAVGFSVRYNSCAHIFVLFLYLPYLWRMRKICS